MNRREFMCSLLSVPMAVTLAKFDVVNRGIEAPPSATPFRKQLEASGRVVDLEGNRLSFDRLAESCYYMSRHRQLTCSKKESQVLVKIIDALMNESLCGELNHAMRGYWTQLYGPQFASSISNGGTSGLGINWIKYDLPEAGVYLAAIQMNIMAREIWFIDWSDLSFYALAETVQADHPQHHMILTNVGGFCA